jgi:hypothetical protein
MKRFSAFLERKDRDNKHHLYTIGKILSRAGFTVHDHLDHHEDSYLYVEKPLDNNPIIETLEFGGIRLYTRGADIISFRPQNKETAEPFGNAYLLDVSGMFKDLMTEGHQEKVGLSLTRYLVEEVLNFFLHCAKAQKEDDQDIDPDSLGKVIGSGSSSGTDYSNQLSNDKSYNR